MLSWAMDEYLKNAQGSVMPLDSVPEGKVRRLGVPMSSLNVTRDVLRFRYRLRSDIETERIHYDLKVKEWRSDGMVLAIEFEEPQAVSFGDFFDQIEIQVIDP